MRGKKALINVISTFSLQIVTIICGFIVPRLILQSFGSAANGLIASITQFLSYISLIDGGFGVVIKSALYKPIANNDIDEISKVLKTSQNIFKKISYIFIIYIIILCFSFPLINNEFSFDFTFTMILVLFIGTFIEYYFGITYKLFLNAKQQIYITSFIQIILYIINTFIVLLLINLNANIHIVKLVSSLIFIIRPLLQYLYVKKKYKINFKKFESNNSLISQRWDGMIQHIAAVIHSNTDIAIITIFSTLSEVSVYSVYLAVMNGIKNLVISISTGIESSFGELIAKNEKEKLNVNFRLYEFIQYNIITIVFTCSAILILPFVKIYTDKIMDADYIRPIFASIFVLAEAVYCTRTMYHSIALTAGKIKETKNSALIEATTNLLLSILLIKPLGIVGIIIGTLVSLLIRYVQLLIYVSQNILERSVFAIKRNFVTLFLSSSISIVIAHYAIHYNVNSYTSWFIYATVIFLLTMTITVIMNLMFNNRDSKLFLHSMKSTFKVRR